MKPSMTLREYLHKFDVPATEFARRIDTSVTSVYRYRDGVRIPDRRIMPRIVTATQGMVTADDFYRECDGGGVAA